MSNSLDKRILRKREESRMHELYRERTMTFLRLPSTNELKTAEERYDGKHLRDMFHCVHGKHHFTPCIACRRSEADAQANQEHAKRSVAQLKKQFGLV